MVGVDTYLKYAEAVGLTAGGLTIATGSGLLNDNGNGTWTYTPALNDSSAVSFSYTINGVTQTKPIAKFVFASPATVCK